MVSLNNVSSTAEAYIEDSAVTDSSSAATDVEATDSSSILSIGGAVGVAKGSFGFGAGVGYNETDSTVSAYVDDATLTLSGPLNVEATTAVTLVGATVGAAGSTKVALAGSASVNLIGNTTEAYISGSSMVNAVGNILVQAIDSSSMVSVAGALALAIGGPVAVGAAVGYNLITNTINAYIAASKVVSSAGTLQVLANAAELLIGMAVSGSGAGTFALGGSVDLNDIENNVNAYASSSTLTGANGLTVAAADSSTMFVVAGAIAGSSGTAAIGASVSDNVVSDSIAAYLDGTKVTGTSSVSVSAGFNDPHSLPNISSVNLGVMEVSLPVAMSSQILSVAFGGSGAEFLCPWRRGYPQQVPQHGRGLHRRRLQRRHDGHGERQRDGAGHLADQHRRGRHRRSGHRVGGCRRGDQRHRQPDRGPPSTRRA